MKSNKIFKALAVVALAFGLAGCSEDYLQLEPVTTIDESTVQTTEEGAQAALYGACRSMYTQYSNLSDYDSFNGESWTSMFYGEVFGSDYFSLLWAIQSGSNFHWTNNTDYQGWVSVMGWRYYYNLINQVNVILGGIDDIEGDVNNLKFIKAQAETLRAYSYFRLLQLYAPRWEDSANGSRKCIVLRKEAGNDEIPLSTMNEVLELIKSDLNDALTLYSESTTRRKYKWEPDKSVAQGVYARVAMLTHDYKTAQKMAHDARQSYPIMTADEFNGGFAEPTSEYMWCNDADVAGIYYYAHGSWYACQGPYPTLWGYGAGSINYDLYKQIPEGDIRAGQFFTPDKPLRSPLTRNSFWNASICNPADMNLNKNANMKISISAYGLKRIPGGDKSKWGEPYVAKESGGESDIRVVFGAQYKFWALDIYGSNSFPYMRSAEMLLTEAEAAYHNGQEAVAKSCLWELNANRYEAGKSYTCDKTGAALLAEIKLQRRIELWGEGHCWFDLKRWNEPMIRRPWKAGDNTSNNIPENYAFRKEPTDMKGWRYAVPQAETQYNHAIDRSELDF